MAADSTDKFRLVAPNTGWQLNASGITDAVVTSFGLVSSTALPTATGVTITIDRVDGSGTKTPAKMERIKGVISGTNVVSCVRGTGGTAQSHAGGAVVEIVIDSTLWNDLINGILTFSNQAGKLIQSAVDGIRYGADAGGDDTYAVTLDPVPAAYYAGMEVNFKPTTGNTGACTLDVNGLGAKTIKKNVSSDLATGDILSGQMVKVIYDGTNFQLVNQTSANGWTSVSDTWSYASASTITVPSGAASLYQKGDKIKLTQTTVKYFYIIGVADTVLTITGGTSYTLVSAAISDISVSHQNTPVGFPQSMNYTPTITSGGGTPTTVTATCKFSIIGDQCKIYEVVTMTNAGTASGEVISTLPVSFSDDRSPLSAWEGASTGFSCVAHGLLSDLTKIGVSKYDFTTIWTTGRVLFISGTYGF